MSKTSSLKLPSLVRGKRSGVLPGVPWFFGGLGYDLVYRPGEDFYVVVGVLFNRLDQAQLLLPGAGFLPLLRISRCLFPAACSSSPCPGH